MSVVGMYTKQRKKIKKSQMDSNILHFRFRSATCKTNARGWHLRHGGRNALLSAMALLTKGQQMENNRLSNAVVFVIDDDAGVREALTELLGTVGLTCEAFDTTAKFLKRDSSTEVSCLILDIRLPERSGLDLQSELATAGIDIPIIFLTAHGDIKMTVKALKAGAVEFLTKPVREEELLDAVRIALERDHARREHETKMRDLWARFHALSPREKAVMELVTRGLMNKQTASEIGISEVTVKVHRHHIMKKMGAKSLADLVRIAGSLGMEREIPVRSQDK